MGVLKKEGCSLCPRACGADREASVGRCGADGQMKIARAALHFWEEPCISGKNGSGAIFFSGCPLHCVYCQNREISNGKTGIEISVERLREICLDLKKQGAHNINLVTPTHFAPLVRESLIAVKKDLALPIIVNTGGYDAPGQLHFFEGVADIYLPDYKYDNSDTAAALSSAPDYPQVAQRALRLMFEQVGKPVFDEKGMLLRGMIVRHLILPGKRKESIAALGRLAELFAPDEILLSVMSQYTPIPGVPKSLDRRITTFEQESVMAYAEKLGFEGYFQERSAAKEEYIPPFDLTGVEK